MKTRKGFVSNSSSSSFCVLGVCTSHPQICNMDLDEVEAKVSEKKLEFQRGLYDYAERYIIGVSPGYIKEDITIRQAKENIVKDINEALGTTITVNEISFHTDGTYEG